MNEFDKVLESGEKLAWQGRPKFVPYMLSHIIVGAVIALFVLIFGTTRFASSIVFGMYLLQATGIILALAAYGYLSYGVTHYAITSKRILIQRGVIGRNLKAVDVDKIENIGVDVNVIDKMFDTGTIRIFSGEMTPKKPANTTAPVYDRMVYIEDPYRTMKKLQGSEKDKEMLANTPESIKDLLEKNLEKK